MAFLMDIAMDNTVRFPRRTYLFEYMDVRFKLVQDNPLEHHDHLLTIVPGHPGHEHPEVNRAFKVAAEFVSALAWETGASMALWDSGGAGWPDKKPLRSATPKCLGFPKVPFAGHNIGGELLSIPHIETDQQRIALALFREARASNNPYLSFLFFFQVMDVLSRRPEKVIDHDLMKKHRRDVRFNDFWLDRLPLGKKSLGTYLLDDCRNAIAHIKRKPGLTTLDLNDRAEQMRLTASVSVIESLAEAFIKTQLGLTKKLFLMRHRRGGVPFFADEKARATGRFVIARSKAQAPLRKTGRFKLRKHLSRRFW